MFKMVKTQERKKGEPLALEVYTKEAETFKVEVIMKTNPIVLPDWLHPPYGKYSWYLYLYIKPNSKLYRDLDKIENVDNFEKGDEIYPAFHCGCNFFKVCENAIILGCGYNHNIDIDMKMSHEAELPEELRADAERLYNYFKELEEK